MEGRELASSAFSHPHPPPDLGNLSGLLISKMIYLRPMEQETIGIPPEGDAKSQRIWARSGSQEVVELSQAQDFWFRVLGSFH